MKTPNRIASNKRMRINSGNSIHKLLLILLIVPVLGFAQTVKDGYIEVKVSDDISVHPNSIEYSVGVKQRVIKPLPGESYDYRYDPRKREKEEREYYKAKTKELKDALKRNGFKVSKNKDSKFNVNSDRQFHFYGQNEVLVNISNESELNKLISTIKKLKYAKGHLGRVHYKKTEELEDTLMDQLMSKAERKAERIAKRSRLQLGKVISVSDARPKDDSKKAFYYYRDAIYRDMEEDKDNLNGKFEKTIIVRYEAK